MFLKYLLLRRLDGSQIMLRLVRGLTSQQAQVALRPFYFAVHPDRFATDPEVRSQNEKSLQVC
jgi:hypothetical protein